MDNVYDIETGRNLEIPDNVIPFRLDGGELTDGIEKKYDPDKRGSGKAWAVLIGGVVIYDIFGKETLSNGFARARESENRLARIASIGMLAVGTAHLMDWLGKRDPIDFAAKKFGDWRGKRT